MSKIRFIGDVHGKTEKYLGIVRDCETSLQLGDFGVGFVKIPEIPLRHRMIRGNHDDPRLFLSGGFPNCLKDGTIWNGIFCVGGAWSPDEAQREEGVDWWGGEQLSDAQFEFIFSTYVTAKPEVVATHDCPTFAASSMFYGTKTFPSRTSWWLEKMWIAHRPKWWMFGHHHRTAFLDAGPTTFVCLGDLEHLDLEVPEKGRRKWEKARQSFAGAR